MKVRFVELPERRFLALTIKATDDLDTMTPDCKGAVVRVLVRAETRDQARALPEARVRAWLTKRGAHKVVAITYEVAEKPRARALGIDGSLNPEECLLLYAQAHGFDERRTARLLELFRRRPTSREETREQT